MVLLSLYHPCSKYEKAFKGRACGPARLQGQKLFGRLARHILHLLGLDNAPADIPVYKPLIFVKNIDLISRLKF